MTDSVLKCCFCSGEIEKKCTPTGEIYWDRGNNPAPVRSGEERCCDFCNSYIVIPARVGQILSAKESQTNDNQTNPR